MRCNGREYLLIRYGDGEFFIAGDVEHVEDLSKLCEELQPDRIRDVIGGERPQDELRFRNDPEALEKVQRILDAYKQGATSSTT